MADNIDHASEAEERPAMEVHLGEVHVEDLTFVRHCIVWMNGKRWEGTLEEMNEGL